MAVLIAGPALGSDSEKIANNAAVKASKEAKSPELLVQRIGDKFKSSGSTIRYEVRIVKSPNSIASFGLNILYDPSLIRYTSSQNEGSLTEDFTFIGANELNEGLVRLGGFTTEEPIPEASTGVLTVLTFEVLVLAPSRLSIAKPVDDVKEFVLVAQDN